MGMKGKKTRQDGTEKRQAAHTMENLLRSYYMTKTLDVKMSGCDLYPSVMTQG